MTDQSSLARFRSWLATFVLELLVVGLLAASVFFFIGAERQRAAHRAETAASGEGVP